MPKAPLLDETAIAEHLAGLRGWERKGDHIVKYRKFDDFRSVIEFLDKITGISDAQDHHPDVHIHWNELTLDLWTHASGGLTERDFRLARAIDNLEVA